MSDIFIQGETLQIGKKVDYVKIQGINETIESLNPKIVNIKGEEKIGGNYVKVITPKIKSASTYYINVRAEVT